MKRAKMNDWLSKILQPKKRILQVPGDDASYSLVNSGERFFRRTAVPAGTYDAGRRDINLSKFLQHNHVFRLCARL